MPLARHSPLSPPFWGSRLLHVLIFLGSLQEAGVDTEECREPEDFASGLISIPIKMSACSAIPLLDTHSRELNSGTGTEICTPTPLAALFTTAGGWEQSAGPRTGERTHEVWSPPAVAHYSFFKRKENLECLLAPRAWTYLGDITLSERSRSQKDNCDISTCVRYLEKSSS